MLNKIAIVDTLTLSLDDSVYGHFPKVTLQLYDALSKGFGAKIVAGSTYKKYFNESKLECLPYFTAKADLDSKSYFVKIKNKVKSLINTIIVLRNKNYDVLVFHDNNQSLLYLLLVLFKPTQHIILIRYTKNRRGITTFLYELIKSKVSFIITSLDSVAKSYSIDSLIIPDYLPTNEFSDVLPDPLYDLVMAGTVSSCKDIEDVLMSVFNSELTVKVAGHFESEVRYTALNAKYKNCNRIIIENKYLSEVEYADLVIQGRFVLLPYKIDSYTNRSSGVILDSLYTGRPVIGSDIEAFNIIKTHNLGFVYNSSLSEVITQIELCDYNSLRQSVTVYRKTLKDSMNILINKIDRLN
jgi:hypothetical protein